MNILTKKLLSAILSLAIIMVFVPSTKAVSSVENTDKIPTYSSVEEWQASGDTSERVRIKKDNNGARWADDYVEYVYVRSVVDKNVRVGYHPQHTDWRYVSGYYFSVTSNITFSASVALSHGPVTVSLSVAKSGGTGFYINADSSRESRPWVRADFTTKIYDMYVYDEFGVCQLYYKEAHKETTASNTEIFVDYR